MSGTLKHINLYQAIVVSPAIVGFVDIRLDFDVSDIIALIGILSKAYDWIRRFEF